MEVFAVRKYTFFGIKGILVVVSIYNPLKLRAGEDVRPFQKKEHAKSDRFLLFLFFKLFKIIKKYCLDKQFFLSQGFYVMAQ